MREFLHRMGREARQGAIGLVIDRDYLEIGFPLEEPPAHAAERQKDGGNAHGQEHQTIADRLGAKVVAQLPTPVAARSGRPAGQMC